MKIYNVKKLPTYNYHLKGKSGKIYTFSGFEFDDIQNINKIEKSIFYIGRTNERGTKLIEVMYIGITNKVCEIKTNKEILNFINNDFNNYSYFLYNEMPFDIEVKFIDIQDNYNFETTLIKSNI
jgi:hypothetical protein